MNERQRLDHRLRCGELRIILLQVAELLRPRVDGPFDHSGRMHEFYQVLYPLDPDFGLCLEEVMGERMPTVRSHFLVLAVEKCLRVFTEMRDQDVRDMCYELRLAVERVLIACDRRDETIKFELMQEKSERSI